MDVRLICISPKAANECAAFLRGHGIQIAFSFGSTVITALTPPSVLKLAEDAFDSGWAHDEDCAKIITDMDAGAVFAKHHWRPWAMNETPLLRDLDKKGTHYEVKSDGSLIIVNEDVYQRAVPGDAVFIDETSGAAYVPAFLIEKAEL